MNSVAAARLTLLEQSGRGPRDEAGMRSALARYLGALELADAVDRPVLFGTTVGHALGLAAEIAAPLDAAIDALRPARVREAHIAANAAAWPGGSVQTLARATWTAARDAAGAIARNARWGAAVATWADTLGPARFARDSLAQRLATRLPELAIDAQAAALEFVAAGELGDGRDPAHRRLYEPLFAAFCAGAHRLWLLPTATVVAPR